MIIGDNELQREARWIFRRLLTENGVLVRVEDGRYTIAHRGKPDRKRSRIAPDFIAAFRARDWIRPQGTTPESFALGEAGAAWLKRTQAEGDPFAAQHQSLRRRRVVDAEGIERVVMANEAESPLEFLRARKLIDACQFEAGERLRRDHTLAQLAPRLGVDLTAPVVLGRRGAKNDQLLSDTVLAAKQRFAHAMKALGPGLADLLYDVCCELIGLEDAERSFSWPSRTGKVVLILALDRLALHYGMTVTAPATSRMRRWQME